MKLEQSNLIVKRAYKEVYKCDEGIEYGKSRRSRS